MKRNSPITEIRSYRDAAILLAERQQIPPRHHLSFLSKRDARCRTQEKTMKRTILAVATALAIGITTPTLAEGDGPRTGSCANIPAPSRRPIINGHNVQPRASEFTTPCGNPDRMDNKADEVDRLYVEIMRRALHRSYQN
jgi:hypothetical protein